MNAPIAPEASRASAAPEGPHKPLDVGTFFDRPSAWTRDRRVQVLLGIGNAACAGVALWGDVAFARVVACTLYLSIALQMFARAWSRRSSR